MANIFELAEKGARDALPRGSFGIFDDREVKLYRRKTAMHQAAVKGSFDINNPAQDELESYFNWGESGKMGSMDPGHQLNLFDWKPPIQEVPIHNPLGPPPKGTQMPWGTIGIGSAALAAGAIATASLTSHSMAYGRREDRKKHPYRSTRSVQSSGILG